MPTLKTSRTSYCLLFISIKKKETFNFSTIIILSKAINKILNMSFLNEIGKNVHKLTDGYVSRIWVGKQGGGTNSANMRSLGIKKNQSAKHSFWYIVLLFVQHLKTLLFIFKLLTICSIDIFMRTNKPFQRLSSFSIEEQTVSLSSNLNDSK